MILKMILSVDQLENILLKYQNEDTFDAKIGLHFSPIIKKSLR